SAGFAFSLGLPDGAITRDQALAHCRDIVAATDLPVSADLEGGFADHPADVAETIRLAADTGLAGCSIEDATGRRDAPIYGFAMAVERVAAAVEAAEQALRLAQLDEDDPDDRTARVAMPRARKGR
ncbi:isocitrate lyase/phosphoenolpyruvate mutase family protein, partial [Candidatus Sumerlaeota bacterium]|nr:isocitrate lyase/phosphoenolpyruvate mutase family protein [Candidatus Sumerlaeota bacterium]